MNIQNLIQYIKMGLTMKASVSSYLSLTCIPIILTVLFLSPAMMIRGYFLTTVLIMLTISIIAFIAVFFFSKKRLTVKRRIIIQSIIYLDFVCQFVLLGSFFFMTSYKSGIGLILFNLPPILVPLIMGIITHCTLKSEKPLQRKKTAPIGFGISGAISGILGITIGKILSALGQDVMTVIGLSCFMLLNGILSIGLLYFQRLYYMFKYEKLGLISESDYNIENDSNQ